MTIRVLIVDDSLFICKRIAEILATDKIFKIVGMARNGQEAVIMAATTEPDVITMDIEMPVMDGISAVKQIMAATPTPILMFSASTQVGAQATLAALDAGAIDFLPKKLDEIHGNHEVARRILRERVRHVALQASQFKRPFLPKVNITDRPKPLAARSRLLVQREFDLLVIVASTGGPVAIQKILSDIPANCPIPILLIQHMPGNFTGSFAQRLNRLSQLQVQEAQNNDELKPGVALLAPGGQQIEVQARGIKRVVVLKPKLADDIYSPCADISLASVAQVYKRKALAIVLTGMGADGRQGAIKMHQAGADIWAQDESSCTIYGMPKAVVDAGIVSKVCTLDALSKIFRDIN